MMQTDLEPDVAVPRLQPNGWRQACCARPLSGCSTAAKTPDQK